MLACDLLYAVDSLATGASSRPSPEPSESSPGIDCIRGVRFNSVIGNQQFKRIVMAKKKLRELVINRDWCKGCAICVKLCPKQVLELDKFEKATVLRPDDCIVCRLCELRCPDLAIMVLTTEEGENGKED